MSYIIALENVHMVVALTGMVSKWSWGRKKILKSLCGRKNLILLCTYQLVSFPCVKFIPRGQKILQKPYQGPILRYQRRPLWGESQNTNPFLFTLFIPLNIIRTFWKRLWFCFSLGFAFTLPVHLGGGGGHLISSSKPTVHTACCLSAHHTPHISVQFVCEGALLFFLRLIFL